MGGTDLSTLSREAFGGQGFLEIVPEAALRKTIEAFYFDLVNYLIILLKDSGLSYRPEIELLEEKLSQGELGEIDQAFQSTLFEVQKNNRALLGHLYEMGTRPNKFLSAEKLFFDQQIQVVIDEFFKQKLAVSGESHPLYVKPYRGETLHLFTPGESQFKYNLPMHQDFQYLGQSSEQLTFWLFLSGSADTGGVRVFPGTHQFGVAECKKNGYGHHEVDLSQFPDFDQNNYIDFGGKQFQLLAFDSLCLHQSLRNSSRYSSRLTYIWRISNIGSSSRVTFGSSY